MLFRIYVRSFAAFLCNKADMQIYLCIHALY